MQTLKCSSVVFIFSEIYSQMFGMKFVMDISSSLKAFAVGFHDFISEKSAQKLTASIVRKSVTWLSKFVNTSQIYALCARALKVEVFTRMFVNLDFTFNYGIRH